MLPPVIAIALPCLLFADHDPSRAYAVASRIPHCVVCRNRSSPSFLREIVRELPAPVGDSGAGRRIAGHLSGANKPLRHGCVDARFIGRQIGGPGSKQALRPWTRLSNRNAAARHQARAQVAALVQRTGQITIIEGSLRSLGDGSARAGQPRLCVPVSASTCPFSYKM